MNAVGLFLPPSSLSFSLEVSKQCATAGIEFTLEFLKEWTSGFSKSSTQQKVAALHLVEPWLSNLTHFAKPTGSGATEDLKSISEVVRGLISITISDFAVSET